MTDRVNGCWVAFKRNTRTDDAEHILGAIRMVKGVAAVSADDCVTDPDEWRVKQQVHSDLHILLDVAISTILTDKAPAYIPDKARTIEKLEHALALVRKTGGS